MKAIHLLIGGVAVLASFQTMASSNIIGEAVFIPCNANTSNCPVLAENPMMFQMIQDAIAVYQQSSAKGIVPKLVVGDGVQVQSLLTTKAGYAETDHFFTIKSLPVTSWSNLNDLGTQHDSDGSVHYVPSGGRADLLGGFDIGADNYDVWAIELPGAGCTGFPC